MKKNKVVLVIFLAILVSLAPISPASLLVFSQENPQIENEYTEITEDFEISGAMEIPAGKTVVVKKGVTITMDSARVDIYGSLIIKGTLNDPVKIKKKDGAYGYFFEVLSGGNLEMMNVDVTGGGTAAFLVEKKSILSTAYAYGPMQGAVDVNGGKFTAQNVNFHDNLIAVSITGNNSSVKVNRSKFLNNYQYEVIRTKTSGTADFRYNWWGNPNGPVMNCNIYNSCWPVSGTINSSNWLSSPDFHDPVIIVPGILGSWKITDGGEWKADPIFKTYESLFETFEKNGYEKDKDLFIFPYQWRDSNVNTALLLKQKIQEIKTANNWPKVDIVAHSMGGLLTREYIKSENYQGDIDQLVMLGTPNAGAPEDYLMWDGGVIPPSNSAITDIIAKLIFKQEAKEAGFDSIFEYLHNQPIKSVQELLPNYDYLYDIASEKMRSYANNEHYPRNIFLENLNTVENIRKLNSVVVTNITGKLDEDRTITKIRVEKPSMDENSLWAHGIPENFNSLFGDHGLEYGNGDGTVPKVSSENIFSDEQLETSFSHSDLPGKTAEIVFKKITGNEVQKNVPFVGTDKVLVFFVFSPIDIQIISPNGKWAGKNINNLDEGNQIEGAYYTGFDTDNEFLTIPNPEDGEYKIVTEGMGNGEYRIEMAKISEDEDGTASEITGEITGTATNGVQEEKTVEVLEGEIITEEKDIVAPAITISSPENKIYLSDKIIPIEFTITDDSSGVDEEKTKIFLDGEIFSQDNIDMAYLEKGEHSLKIFAQDKAENSQEEIVNFITQPSIDSIIANVEHYYADKFITKKSTKNYLEAKLRVIKIHKMLYNAINLSPWPARFKNQLLENIAKNINREVDKLILDIQEEKSVTKNILEPAKSVLIENLGEMMMQ